jgi:DNA-binding CsgD family transcriptional regulator
VRPGLDVGECDTGQRYGHGGGVAGDDDRVAALPSGVDQDRRAPGGGGLQVGQARRQEEAGEAGLLADLGQQLIVLGPQAFAVFDLTSWAGPRRRDLLDGLTARELDVLALMAQGRSNQAIADALTLTGKTVESHVRNIFQRLTLPTEADHHRRVLAVLAYLRSSR